VSVALSSKSAIGREAPTLNCVGLICKRLGFVGDFRSWIVQPHPTGCGAISVLEPVEKH
jgi:hypothetical protein